MTDIAYVCMSERVYELKKKRKMESTEGEYFNVEFPLLSNFQLLSLSEHTVFLLLLKYTLLNTSLYQPIC